jgi:hypothetical protein
MARTHKKRTRGHKRGRGRTTRYNRKNIIAQSASAISNTSKRYMPKVKNGLENVGSSVVQTGEKTVPLIQGFSRKFFSLFGSKKRRKH